MTIKFKGFEFENLEQVKEAQEMGIIEKHDTVDASPHIQPAHGLWHDANLGGLWTGVGAEPDVYHTIVRPTISAFLNQLYVGVTEIENPDFDVLSGVLDINGAAAADACSDAPNAGEAKLCTLTSRFGEMNLDVPQADITDLGGRINRADVDRRLVNDVNFNNVFLPSVVQRSNINTTGGLAMIRAGITVEREVSRLLWTGEVGS